MGTIAQKGQAAIDSINDIQDAINEMGVEVDNTVPLTDYGDKIREIQAGEGSEWQPHPDWWDIEKLLKNNPTYLMAAVITDSNNSITIDPAKFGSSIMNYITSDNAIYSGASGQFTHTWNTALDKPCADGYKTRFIVCYGHVGDKNIACNIITIDALYVYIGNGANVTAIEGYQTTNIHNIIIQSIKCDSSVTASANAIGINALRRCYSLTSITIPKGATSIGNYAFEYCYSLKSITIPNSVTSISSYAFSNLKSLKLITIPNSVTSIGSNAFSYSSLKLITIPNSVTSIGNYAFRNSDCLKLITIPNSVTSIGTGIIDAAIGLISFNIEQGWIPNSTLDFSQSTKLSVSSIVSFFTNLGTTVVARIITIGATNIAKLTPQQIAIATNKGYTIN